MSDLDEIARATQVKRSEHRPALASRHPVSFGKRRFLIPLAAVLLLGAAISVWQFYRTSMVVVVAKSPFFSENKSVDPGFSITRRTFGGVSASWEIENEKSGSLVINSVVINGEFTAPLGVATSNWVKLDKSRSLPISLTIGDSADFVEWDYETGTGYKKHVIFIDIDTNRGKFRYRDGSGWEKI